MPKSEVMRTPKGRISFVKMKELRYQDDDVNRENGTYSMNMIFKEGTDLSELKNAATAVLYAEFGEKEAQALMQAGKLKVPFKKASTVVDKDGKRWAGYENDEDTALSLKCYNPIVAIDQYGTKYSSNGHVIAADASGVTREVPGSAEAETVFYAGCYCSAAIYFKSYDHPKGGKGVTAYIGGLRKLAEGEPLGEASSMSADEVEDFFSDLPVESRGDEPTQTETSAPAGGSLL